MIKYFHKLTKEEFDKLVGKVTYQELSRDYPQPPWCDYPGATEGYMGCWSLMGHKVKDENYCVGVKCDLYKKKNK
jgi:hypothetical protein